MIDRPENLPFAHTLVGKYVGVSMRGLYDLLSCYLARPSRAVAPYQDIKSCPASILEAFYVGTIYCKWPDASTPPRTAA